MTKKDDKAHVEADLSCECKNAFGSCRGKSILKVHQYDHKTGDYIGATHADCNLRIGIILKVEIAVSFHNGKGNGSHFIIQTISRLEDIQKVKLSDIPDNNEKHIMGNFRGYMFMDSISLLNSGLGTISYNLIGDDPKNAPRFHEGSSVMKDFPLTSSSE
jgi:hypothetical protein